MARQVLIYLVTFGILYVVGLYLHTLVLEKNEILLSFHLQKMYLFHAGFSAFLCFNFAVFSKFDAVKDQLGFIYLGTMVAKIAVFCMVFYKVVFSTTPFSKAESLSLLIPIFLFLFLEVFFIARILNKEQSVKNK